MNILGIATLTGYSTPESLSPPDGHPNDPPDGFLEISRLTQQLMRLMIAT